MGTHRIRSRRHRLAALVAPAAVLAILATACEPPPKQPTNAGDPDTGFAEDGIQDGHAGSGNATASALQADGKVVVAGTGRYDDGSATLTGTHVTRHNPDGSPDTGYASVNVNLGPSFEAVKEVTIDGQGRALVVGVVDSTYPDITDLFLLRVKATGGVDTSFGGGDGYVVVDRTNHDRPGGVAVRGDRIYVAGSYDFGGNFSRQWIVTALDANGNPDNGFSGDGVAEVPPTLVDTADGLADLAVQPDGKIVLGGTFGSDYASVRLRADGTVDTSWDGDGLARVPFELGGAGLELLLQGDGKVVLAGHVHPTGRSDDDMAAVRWTTTGALDTSFSGDGKAFVDFGANLNERALSGALAADGKIVLAGFSFAQGGMDHAVARLNWDGTPDTSFSGDGRVVTSSQPTANEQLESVVIGTGDRVTSAGWNHDGWVFLAHRGGATRTVSVDNATVAEPAAGSATATVDVRLSSATTGPVTARWATANGTAAAPADLTASSGVVSFAAGQTTRTVTVPVLADTAVEGNESFRVTLSLPANAGIGDGSATVTVTDQD